MTENNIETGNGAATDDKGENTVPIAAASKEKTDAMEKIKRSLKTKKSWATRTIGKLEAAIQVFKDSAAKDAAEKTLATKIQLKKNAKEVIENESKVKDYQKDLEKLVEQLQEALNDSPTAGTNLEEAMEKVEVDTYEYVDRIDIVLKNHNVLLAEAESASIADTSAPAQRNVSIPTTQQILQGDVFRDVTVLKPNFLEKGSNLLEVLHWIKQARTI